MALRRDDPYTDLARAYINRGTPEEPARASTPPVKQTPSLREYTDAERAETRRERAVAERSETQRAFASGMAGVESGLYATRGLIRSAVGGNGDADLERAVAIQQAAAEQGPRVRQVKDIEGVGDALEYARNIAVEQIPNLATIIGTGGVAGLARAGLGRYARNRAITEAAEAAAVRQAARAGTDAAASAVRDNATRIARRLPAATPQSQTAKRLGAAAAGATLQGGQMTEAALDDTQVEDRQQRALMAGAGAIITGALEAIPVMSLLRRYGPAGAERAITGGVARRMATHAVRQGAQESATEVAQTFGELATHKWINDNVQLMDAKAIDQYVNAAVGGAVGGAIYGAPAGIRGGARGGEQTRSRLVEGLQKGLDKVRAKMGDVGRPIEGTAAPTDGPAGAGDLHARFDEHLQRARNQAENSAILSELDADPYDFNVVDSEVVLGGAPLRGFINQRASEALLATGMDPIAARLASPIEDGATIGRLRAEGALDAAVRVFRGDDIGSFTDAEKQGWFNYLQALPEKRRHDMLRVSSTWEDMADKGYLRRDEQGRMVDNDLYDPSSAGPLAQAPQDGETQELARQQGTKDVASTDLRERTPAQLSRDVFRAARGPQLSQGYRRAMVIEREDGSGDRREVNLYSGIEALREADPGFQRSINALPPGERNIAMVAAVLANLAENGYMVDSQSIKAMDLTASGNWKLTDRQATRIKAALGDPDAKAALAELAGPLAPRERAIDDRNFDPRSEIPEISGQERAPPSRGSIERTPVRPGQGASQGTMVVEPDPRGTPVAAGPTSEGVEATQIPYAPQTAPKEGKPEQRAARAARLQTATADSGAVDTTARAFEGAVPNLKSGLRQLDNTIANFGGRRPRTAQERRLFIADLRGRLTDGKLRALNERVHDAARLNVADVAKRLADARDRLQERDEAIEGKKGREKQDAMRERSKVRTEVRELTASLEAAKTAEAAARRLLPTSDRAIAKQAVRTRAAKKRRKRAVVGTAAQPTAAEQAARATRDRQVAAANAGSKAAKEKADKRAELKRRDAERAAARRQAEAAASRARAEKIQAERERESREAAEQVAARNVERTRRIAREKAENEVGRDVGERIAAALRRGVTQNSATNDATTVAKYLRASFEQNANVREFRAAIGRLMETAKGAQAMVRKLGDMRSRYGLVELMHAVNDHRNKPGFDVLAGPLMARVEALNREVSESGRRQSNREQLGGLWTVDMQQHIKVRDALIGKTRLHEALAAVREFASPAQQRMIDKLSGTSTQNVAFDTELHTRGASGGYHDGLSNRVVIKLSLNTLPERTTNADGTVTHSFENGFTNDVIDVLIHEAAHAATTWGEQRNPQVRKDLNALLNHVRKLHPDANEWYGLSDTQEFIAEAFGNPQFRRLLEQTPALNTKSFQNLWQEFMSVVRRVLGITDQADITALDEVMTLATQLQRDTAASRMATLGNMFAGHGNAGVQNSPHATQPTNWVAMLPPDARARLLTAFESTYVKNQIKRILPPDQHRFIDAADTGPELLINLGVGMHLAGRLNLQSKDRGVVRQLWDMMSKFLRIPNANVYGAQILKDIQSGYLQQRGKRYDAQRRTIVRDNKDQIGKAMLGVTRWVDKNAMPLFDGLLKNMNTRVRETGVPALRQLTTLVAQRTGEFRADRQRAYRQNWQDETNKRLNQLAQVIAGITPEQERVLVRALQNGSLPKKHDGLQKTFDGAREYLDSMYEYMRKAGVDVGRRDNFFPVVMDAAKVEARREVFFELHRAPNFDQPIRDKFTQWTQKQIDAIEPDAEGLFTKEQLAEVTRLQDIIADMPNRDIDELIGELYDMALYGGREHYIAGVNFADAAHVPAFSSAKPRTSSFIFEYGTPEQIRTFTTMQATNLSSILVNYTKRATRRAEWERMGMTSQITTLLDQAREQGASPQEIRLAQDYLNMEMGTYNDSWNPVIKRMMQGVDRVFGSNLAQTDFQKWKAIQGALQTYNNVRLLPLALVSSFVDPLAAMVRSGSMRDAHRNLFDAMKAMRGAGGKNELRAMADKLGVIEREGLGDIMAHLYGGVYDPNSTAGKINQTLFKYNGLESMLRFTRLAALAAGHRFLARHAASDSDTSKRYLQELGLTAADIRIRNDGYVALTPRVQAALRRFVDESTVRPYAGQKPSWHNDPNFALAAQYKGYIYAFYETVLLRAANELREGNLSVLAPVLAYIPITMMAEMARDMVQGDEPEEPEEYLKKGIDRSGLLGPRISATGDATTNVQYGSGLLGNAAGATGQQLGDAYDVLSGGGSFSNLAVEALPGQALYKNWGD